MRPYRSSMFANIPPVVKNLLIINVLVFLADNALLATGFDLSEYLALRNVQSDYFKPFQFISHMFMHARISSPSGIFHILFNMFMLYMFGRMLEMVWGGKRFLIYYLLSGVGAAVMHSLVNYFSLQNMHTDLIAFLNTPSADGFLLYVREYLPNASRELNDFINAYSVSGDNSNMTKQAMYYAEQIYKLHLDGQTVGASGAVFGVLLAFGMLFPNMQLMLIFPPIPVKAKFMVIFMGLVELFAGVMPSQGDNVAHFAHLGGMIFGFILIKYWQSKGIGKYDRM